MKIIACCKIVPDEEEIRVLPDRTLDLEGVSTKISHYDLNALECGKKLAAETGGSMTALSVGKSALLSPSKIRKDILSRGAADLSLVIDDDRTFSDSLETAKVLAKAAEMIGSYDLILCGMGSSDLYLQETGIQIGTILNLPVTNNAVEIRPAGDGIIQVDRALENEIETLELPLPAVVSVSSEINVPAVPSMRDIMGAGKKPVTELDKPDVQTTPALTTLSELAPEQQERRQEITEGDGDEAIEKLVQFLKKECL
ncbi:MAG: putative electron transfer flavoprotein FixA [Lachnospiraceae bacterium]|nr:putative electron transfer flavoprotein FixA [Lachnospiraceae bacterium]